VGRPHVLRCLAPRVRDESRRAFPRDGVRRPVENLAAAFRGCSASSPTTTGASSSRSRCCGCRRRRPLSTATGARAATSPCTATGDRPDGVFRRRRGVMLAHGGRPHWGKMHTLDAAVCASAIRASTTSRLRDRLDPDRLFRNLSRPRPR
jgi:hypothetical protein